MLEKKMYKFELTDDPDIPFVLADYNTGEKKIQFVRHEDEKGLSSFYVELVKEDREEVCNFA